MLREFSRVHQKLHMPLHSTEGCFPPRRHSQAVDGPFLVELFAERTIKSWVRIKPKLKMHPVCCFLWVWQEGSEAERGLPSSSARRCPVGRRHLALLSPKTEGELRESPVIQSAAIQSEQQVDGFDPALKELTDCDQGGSR